MSELSLRALYRLETKRQKLMDELAPIARQIDALQHYLQSVMALASQGVAGYGALGGRSGEVSDPTVRVLCGSQEDLVEVREQLGRLLSDQRDITMELGEVEREAAVGWAALRLYDETDQDIIALHFGKHLTLEAIGEQVSLHKNSVWERLQKIQQDWPTVLAGVRAGRFEGVPDKSRRHRDRTGKTNGQITLSL
jgi:hypothetical protein